MRRVAPFFIFWTPIKCSLFPFNLPFTLRIPFNRIVSRELLLNTVYLLKIYLFEFLAVAPGLLSFAGTLKVLVARPLLTKGSFVIRSYLVS